MKGLKAPKGGPGTQISIGPNGSQFKTYGNPLPYVAPWAIGLAMLALACPVRTVLARDSYAWFWSAACAIGYIALTFGVYFASRPRGKLTNVVATLGTAGASAWSWYVAGVPHLTWRPLAVYAIGMIVACGVSNALSAFREGGQPGPTMNDRLTKALSEVRNINAPRVVNGSVVAEIEAEPGSSVAGLQKDVPAALESLHDLPEGSVRITKGRPGTSTRQGQVHLTPVDYLASPPPYTGPSIRDGAGPFGYGTLMDPLTFGRRQGGQPLQLWLPGDARVHRNASLIQATGASGAGKSWFIRALLVEAMSRGGPDVFEYWYLNSRKADQEPSWVARGAGRFESTKKSVVRALRDLYAEIDGRQRAFGAAGYEQWAPGAPAPFRLVIADEFADVAPDVERLLTDLSETLRSLGIVLLAGLQRATHDRFPTSARANFGTHVCFGVRDDVDASMALPDDVLDALGETASPARWGNKKPGMCYLSAPGVPEDLWTMPARTWAPNIDLQRRWAEHLIDLRSGTAAVEPYAEEGDLVDDDQYEEGDMIERVEARMPAADEDLDLDRFDDAAAADEAAELVEELMADDPGADHDDEVIRPTVPADTADVHTIDHLDQIAVDGGGMHLALTPKMPPAQAQQFLRDHLAELRAGGASVVKVEQFGEEVLAVTGMGASWLSKHLGRLAEGPDAMLVKLNDSGWYEFRAPAALPRP